MTRLIFALLFFQPAGASSRISQWTRLLVPPAHAATQPAAALQSLPQLIPLSKMTVGPDDQYDATISPDEKWMVLTHKSDLVAHLRIQNLQDGQVLDLTPLSADAQDAKFFSDGRIAFTYFRNNARGDICYSKGPVKFRPLRDEDMDCLDRAGESPDAERSSPFWLSAQEIGFLSRDLSLSQARLMSKNLKTHQTKEWARGSLWGPSASEDGRYLIFHQSEDFGSSTPAARMGMAQSPFVLMDLQTSRKFFITLDLPGVSGVARVSPDGKFVFFSHFLKDTNQDHAVDGRDNSMIFRIPLQKVLENTEGRPLFPEALTSVESSCSFPTTSKNFLYMTCAFENNLDIYRVPPSGIVPTVWGADEFRSAMRTARSYADRVLLDQVAQYRLQERAPLRLLADDVLSDDYASALYELREHSHFREAKTLEIFFEARRLFLSEEPNLHRDRYLASFSALRKSLRLATRGSLEKWIELHLDEMAGESANIPERFLKTPLAPDSSPLEAYLYHEMINSLWPRTGGRAKRADFNVVSEAFTKLLKVRALPVQTQMYELSDFLSRTDKAFPQAQDRLQQTEQIERRLDASLSNEERALLEGQKLALNIILAGTTGEEKLRPARQNQEFAKLDKVLTQAKSSYFLRHALNVRTIALFAEFNQLRFLDFIAADWIRDTPRTDAEFIYAREFVVDASLTEGYADWAAKKYALANGYFYNALTLTDDLESHAGYIKLQALQKKEAGLDSQYAYLQSHHLTEENFNYVRALRLVMDQNSTAAKRTDSEVSKSFEEALKSLDAIGNDRNSATRYLLIGAIELQKVQRSRRRADFSEIDFQEAHRNLMLAFDQGLGNDRVRAAALMNLGVLHQLVGNFSMSARFFAQRAKYGFVDPSSEQIFAGLYAKSLFHSFRPDEAAREIAKLPANTLPAPLLEREAFYWAMAEDFTKSCTLYAELLQKAPPKDDESLAKIQLMNAYVHIKTQDPAGALVAIRESLDHIQRMATPADNETRLLPMDPALLKMTALGFAAQVESTPEKRLEDWKERLRLLKSHSSEIESAPVWILKADLQVAMQNLQLKNTEAFLTSLEDAAHQAESIGQNSTYLNQDVSQSLLQTLSALFLSRNVLDPARAERVANEVSVLMQKYAKAYAEEPHLSSQTQFEALKIRLAAQACQKFLPGLRLGRNELPGPQIFKSLEAEGKNSQAEIEKWRKSLRLDAL